jgi:hypothetical protein
MGPRDSRKPIPSEPTMDCTIKFETAVSAALSGGVIAVPAREENVA